MNYRPARKIANKGSRKNTGYFPSKKNKRPIAFESLLERDYMYLLEYDKEVISYKEQPLTIDYILMNNKIGRYTPDFLVEHTNSILLIEIKPKNKLQELLKDSEMIHKYNIAAQFCKSNGYTEFKIVTDEDIRSGNLLNNIKYLFSYSNLDVPSSTSIEIKNILLHEGPLQIFDILSLICEDESSFSKNYAYILAMIYNQELSIDLSLPINKRSIVKYKFSL